MQPKTLRNRVRDEKRRYRNKLVKSTQKLNRYIKHYRVKKQRMNNQHNTKI